MVVGVVYELGSLPPGAVVKPGAVRVFHDSLGRLVYDMNYTDRLGVSVSTSGFAKVTHQTSTETA